MQIVTPAGKRSGNRSSLDPACRLLKPVFYPTPLLYLGEFRYVKVPRRCVPFKLVSKTCTMEAGMRFGPFLVIAILLAILWTGSFVMFHVASGLIHLLLLFAIISLVIHFLRGARTA